MHLAHLRLRDFRNYARLDVDFSPGFHLLLGDNAQGKTNILEAIYLLATLRSFRGVGGAQMIRHGAKGYFVGADVIGQGDREVKIYWSAAEKKLALDGQPVKKLSDYLGTLRAVVFCTEDLLLVKGTARARERSYRSPRCRTRWPPLVSPRPRRSTSSAFAAAMGSGRDCLEPWRHRPQCNHHVGRLPAGAPRYAQARFVIRARACGRSRADSSYGTTYRTP